MRTVPLTVVKGGINRLRTKGGARADDLYLLENGYVTEQHTTRARPGTLREAELPPGTHGLAAFGGRFHVFVDDEVDLDAFPLFVQHVLLHPFEASAAIAEIHFAEPFLGALYVVAEFDTGDVFHYWLQSGSPWESLTEYAANDFVEPTLPNGFVYRATRFGDPYPAWSPGVARTAGNGSSIEPSRIEPTEYNEFFYEAVETQGDDPRSGSVEPAWPTASGAQIVENTDGSEASPIDAAKPPAPPAPNKPQSSTTAKYDR